MNVSLYALHADELSCDQHDIGRNIPIEAIRTSMYIEQYTLKR